AKDDGRNDGNLMVSSYQEVPGTYNDEVFPLRIAAVKTSDGRYYALVNGGGYAVNVFDATDRSNPIHRSSIQNGWYAFAKTTNADRVAITTPDGRLQMFTSDSYVVGGQPIATFTGAGGSTMKAVTSDGSTFWATNESSSGLILSSFTPSGNSYTRAHYPTGKVGGIVNIRYGDGYLTWTGSTNGPMNLRLFKLQNGVPVEIDFGDYFQHYSIAPAVVQHATPNFSALYDSTVIKRGNHAYLITTAYSLGDVYEIPSSDSVSVTNLGPSGT